MHTPSDFQGSWPPPPGGPTPAGFVRVDCQLHTFASGDSSTTLDDLARRIEETGLDVVCITDHHEIHGALAALERDMGARIVVGEEIRTPHGEVIGLWLTERIPYVIPLRDAAERIRAQGGLVYAPHPFDPDRKGLGHDALLSLHEEGLLDAVEAFNAKVRAHEHNVAGVTFAAEYGLPTGAGSDAHDPEGIGAAYVEVPDFDGPQDFLAKLYEGRVVGEFRDHARRFLPRTAADRR